MGTSANNLNLKDNLGEVFHERAASLVAGYAEKLSPQVKFVNVLKLSVSVMRRKKTSASCRSRVEVGVHSTVANAKGVQATRDALNTSGRVHKPVKSDLDRAGLTSNVAGGILRIITSS